MIEKKIYEKNHSIFYCAQKKENKNTKIKIPNKYDKYLNLFKNYFDYNKNKINKINQLIEKADSPVYQFGGHAASQYLINYGLNTESIKMIIDNDSKKHGKRLYGTDLTVQSPTILEKEEKAYVILRQGVFNEEIKKGILENININIEFWE